MSIQSDIISALSAVASGRVYPQAAPQDAAMPFVIYRRLSQEPLTTIHSASVVATRSTFVFECYAETYAEALSTAETVRAAFLAASPTLDVYAVPSSGEEYAPAIDAYMEPVELGFWH